MLSTVHRSPLITSAFMIHLSQFWLCSKDCIGIITHIYIDITFYSQSNFHNKDFILTQIIHIFTYSSRLYSCLVYMYIFKEETW